MFVLRQPMAPPGWMHYATVRTCCCMYTHAHTHLSAATTLGCASKQHAANGAIICETALRIQIPLVVAPRKVSIVAAGSDDECCML